MTRRARFVDDPGNGQRSGPRRRAPTACLLLAVLALVTCGPGARAAAEDCVLIEDFAKEKIDEFPPDWKLRKESGRAVYTVREQDGRRFLHAAARGIGIQAAKQREWDLSTYPILAWSWRPMEFPK